MIRPVHDQIVLRPIAKGESVTDAGIILPDTLKQGKLIEAEVVAVSGGGYAEQTGVWMSCIFKVGDIVLYNSYVHLNEYKLKNETVVILKQKEIVAVVETEEA
jgi:co-chaperonin GroES (HSP10)